VGRMNGMWGMWCQFCVDGNTWEFVWSSFKVVFELDNMWGMLFMCACMCWVNSMFETRIIIMDLRLLGFLPT
jgi:hypothetical protein